MFTAVVIESNDLPDEALEELLDLWANNEYGNDSCYHSWDNDGVSSWSDRPKYPALAAYIDTLDADKSNILLHNWW